MTRQLRASDRGDRCNYHEEIGNVEHDPSARRGLEKQHRHDERQHRDEQIEAALEEHLGQSRACAVDRHVSPPLRPIDRGMSLKLAPPRRLLRR
jgi:hypothetical protein